MSRARRTWHYRLVNEDVARRHVFENPVVRQVALIFLHDMHGQLIVEIWAR